MLIITSSLLLAWGGGIFLPSELDYTITPHMLVERAGLEIISHYECFYEK